MIEIDLARCGFSQAAVGSRHGRAVSGGLEKGISRIVAVTHYARWSQRSSGEQNGDSAGNFTARDLGSQLRLESGISAPDGAAQGCCRVAQFHVTAYRGAELRQLQRGAGQRSFLRVAGRDKLRPSGADRSLRTARARAASPRDVVHSQCRADPLPPSLPPSHACVRAVLAFFSAPARSALCSPLTPWKHHGCSRLPIILPSDPLRTQSPRTAALTINSRLIRPTISIDLSPARGVRSSARAALFDASS